MQSVLTAAKPHLGNVQALRAVAALFVVGVHAALVNVGVESVLRAGEPAWLTSFGFVGLGGVDLFFVISGFIMLVTNWAQFGRPFAGRRFFARRAIRIYPPYWLALAPVLPVLAFGTHRFMSSHSGVKTGILESILLIPNPNKFVLTVAWTLVWEMIFYAIFTFMLRLDRKSIGWALGAWFAIELGLYAAFRGSPNFYLNFIATPLPLEFIFGAVVGLLYIKRRFPAPRVIAPLCICVAAAAWTLVGIQQISLVDINNINRIVLFGVPAMLLVYGSVALEVSGLFVAPAFVQSIGDGSYAIYLWHISIMVGLRQVIERLQPAGPLAHLAVLILTFAVVIAAGMLIYRFFERPVTAYLNARLALWLPRPGLERSVTPRAIVAAVTE